MTRSANQAKIATNIATAVRIPPELSSNPFSVSQLAVPTTATGIPTRMICGMARKNRKNVVSRFRSSS